jgi:hypothetical protein
MGWIALRVIPSFHCTEAVESIALADLYDESPALFRVAS